MQQIMSELRGSISENKSEKVYKETFLDRWNNPHVGGY